MKWIPRIFKKQIPLWEMNLKELSFEMLLFLNTSLVAKQITVVEEIIRRNTALDELSKDIKNFKEYEDVFTDSSKRLVKFHTILVQELENQTNKKYEGRNRYS